jgi:membrane-associated phospholipid phosphatase
VRPYAAVLASLSILAHAAGAQAPDSVRHDKTFLTRRDLGITAAAVGATALLTIFDDDIAQASQKPRFQGSGLRSFSSKVSKVNETTLTVAGIVTYGIGRLSGSRMVTDVALHSTEAVVLASLASQIIRGPLGRARPYVTNDTNQYDFKFMGGFKSGEEGFSRRAFPSIHTSSSMAVATVLAMEVNRRNPSATKFVAPVLFAAGMLPGLARIQLDQHWASDVAAGAFMGVFAGYKVVSYSHDHPDNVFDRALLKTSVAPDPMGGVRVGYNRTF